MDNPSIIKIHPTHILIKDDLPFTDEEMDELRICAHATWTHHYEHGIGEPGYHVNSDPFPLFTEENIKLFPALDKVRDEFKKGFGARKIEPGDWIWLYLKKRLKTC